MTVTETPTDAPESAVPATTTPQQAAASADASSSQVTSTLSTSVTGTSKAAAVLNRMEMLYLTAALVVLGLIAALVMSGNQVDSNWWLAAGALLLASGVAFNPKA